MATNRERATSTERMAWLSPLLTLTPRYQPTRTSSVRPFSSLLFMWTDNAAFAWRASIRQTYSLEFVQPARHGTRLESDPLSMWRAFAKQLCQGSGIGLGFSVEHNLPSIIDNADAGLLLRHIQPDIMFHDEFLPILLGRGRP